MNSADPHDGSAFDELLAEAAVEPDAPRPARTSRWLLPTITASFAVIGGVVVIAGIALFLHPTDTAVSSSPGGSVAGSSTASPAATPATQPTSTPTFDIPPTGISTLADAGWVSEVAAAGRIPERALAAYAGAAILLAETRPTCNIGWNTLAAIGFVETEHGTMNGATLNEDGTVAPAIVGIALDGNGTLAVPDTDNGTVDGDAVWDRAVGPMQFTPRTWALEGIDGNGDGVIDINQIDDAALSAGTHLCNVGGNLSVASNWISAIHAYNPSVEYNNRVAEAANYYASLP
ncbi:hypothetical protein GCM10009808_11240 [Microbacterium sediminicola]|uniref:Transglycosylase SLT domain-containing protein n=1 Tax=Microbacterium sediminicola TaxID=415210 RepID=A0ABP4TY27_9MICO